MTRKLLAVTGKMLTGLALGWILCVPPVNAQSTSPAPKPPEPAADKSDKSDRPENDRDREPLRDQSAKRRDGTYSRDDQTSRDASRTSRDSENPRFRERNQYPDTRSRDRDRDSDRDRDEADEDRSSDRDQDQDSDEDRSDRSTARDRLRDDVRDTVRGARDTARDARDTARGVARDARDTARDVRDTTSGAASRSSSQAFDVNTVRSADVGLWFNRGTRNGLVISDIATSGPISQIGFRDGDRIVSVNGYRVRDERQFVRDLFDEDYRNDRVPVIVDRNGTQRTVYVQPSTLVDHYATSSSSDPLEDFGIVLDDRYHDRLLVWKVVPRTPAYYAGVRGGDVITAWNNQRVTNKNQVVQGLENVSEGDEVWITVNRGQQQKRLEAEITNALTSQPQARTTYRPTLEENYVEPTPVETYPSTERTRPMVPSRPAIVPRPGILPRNR